MTITLITSGFIGLLMLVLAFNVVRHRGMAKKSLGIDEEGSGLHRAIRAHANLTEYAPTMLVLIAALEYMQANTMLVLCLAAAFTTGRYMHGYGLGFTAGTISFWRMVGTLATWLSMLVASLAALYYGYFA